MATVFDVNAVAFIAKLKDELKNVEQIKPAEWSKFVKSSATRTKPPEQEDFWYIRTASILRQMYVQGRPLGVQRLRGKYGGKQQNRAKPKHFVKGCGKIIRNILQQLESAGLIQKTTINNKKGRVLTSKGKSYLDKIAAGLKKGA